MNEIQNFESSPTVITEAPAKMSKFSWKNTVYFRLLATLILVVLPLYVIGTNLYQWGVSTIRDQVTEANVSQVKFYLDTLETDIQRIQVLMYDFLNDENLNELANTSGIMTDFDISRSVERLKQRLNSIKSSSRYIEEATAFIPPIGKSVAAVRGYHDLDKDRFVIETLPLLSMPSGTSRIEYHDRTFRLTAALPLFDAKIPLYMIEVRLSAQNIQDALIDSEQSGGGFVLVDSNGGTVFDSSGSARFIEALYAGVGRQLLNPESDAVALEIDGNQYLAVFEKSEYLDMAMIRYIPSDAVFKPLNNYKVWFWLFSLSALLIIILFSYSLYSFIHRPLLKLIRAFRMLQDGDLQIRIRHKHNDDFNYLYTYFNQTVEKLNVLIDQVFRQKILVQKAELKHLQAQINPHFLYNSFFILHRMIKGKDFDNSLELSRQLGNYMKYITRSAAEETDLANEVQHAHSYAGIQAMRFSNRLRIEFPELPEQIAGTKVPRLILQPIIENAVLHGLQNKVQGGVIQIAFPPHDRCLMIEVEDNGEELSDVKLIELERMLTYFDEERETTGLLNIHRRIQLKYGLESGITVSRSELAGLKVTLRIF